MCDTEVREVVRVVTDCSVSSQSRWREEKNTLREGRKGLEDVVEGWKSSVVEEMDKVLGWENTDMRAQRGRQR